MPDDVKKPKIFVFANATGPEGWIPCYALAEDGYVLGTHICSNQGYAQYDLGVVPGYRLDRHETYKKHYPNGYEMEFVPFCDAENHKGLQEALKKNKEIAEREEKNV